MLDWENNPDNWKVSGTKKPFTREEMEIFVNGVHDLKLNQQIRFVICLNENKKPIGTIDLFDYDSINSAGIGILIAEETSRNQGFASDALGLISTYCRNELNLVNLFCNIQKNNTISIRFFEKNGFQFKEERNLFNNKVNYYELKL